MKGLVLIGVCAVLLLAACGGGGGGNPDVDQIKAAYTGFFTEKSSLDAHVALLENGAKFKPVIEGFLNSPYASGVSATVSNVTLEGAKKAKVVYTVKTSIGPLSPIPKLSRFGSPLSRRPCQKLTDAFRAIEDSDAALRRSGGDAWRLATRELMHGRWIGLMSAAGWRIRHVSKGSRVSPIIVCVAWQRVELTANLLTAFSLRC